MLTVRLHTSEPPDPDFGGIQDLWFVGDQSGYRLLVGGSTVDRAREEGAWREALTLRRMVRNLGQHDSWRCTSENLSKIRCTGLSGWAAELLIMAWCGDERVNATAQMLRHLQEDTLDQLHGRFGRLTKRAVLAALKCAVDAQLEYCASSSALDSVAVAEPHTSPKAWASAVKSKLSTLLPPGPSVQSVAQLRLPRDAKRLVAGPAPSEPEVAYRLLSLWLTSAPKPLLTMTGTEPPIRTIEPFLKWCVSRVGPAAFSLWRQVDYNAAGQFEGEISRTISYELARVRKTPGPGMVRVHHRRLFEGKWQSLRTTLFSDQSSTTA